MKAISPHAKIRIGKLEARKYLLMQLEETELFLILEYGTHKEDPDPLSYELIEIAEELLERNGK